MTISQEDPCREMAYICPLSFPSICYIWEIKAKTLLTCCLNTYNMGCDSDKE